MVAFASLVAHPSLLKCNPKSVHDHISVIKKVAVDAIARGDSNHGGNDERELTYTIVRDISSKCKSFFELKLVDANSRVDDLSILLQKLLYNYTLGNAAGVVSENKHRTPVRNLLARMIWKSPRLLVEKQNHILARIAWIIDLLTPSMSLSPIPLSLEATWESGTLFIQYTLPDVSHMLVDHPRLLCAPMAVFCRLEFVSALMSISSGTKDPLHSFVRCTKFYSEEDDDGDGGGDDNDNDDDDDDDDCGGEKIDSQNNPPELSLSLIPIILDCNTSTFISQLYEIDEASGLSTAELDFMYSIYLQHLVLKCKGKRHQRFMPYLFSSSPPLSAHKNIDDVFISKRSSCFSEEYLEMLSILGKSHYSDVGRGDDDDDDDDGDIRMCVDEFVNDVVYSSISVSPNSTYTMLSEIKERELCGVLNNPSQQYLSLISTLDQ